MTVLRIHRDFYPKTDHGYTWVETIWFERDGKTVSPLIPAAGCCERLISMPGGPVICDMNREQQLYAPEGIERTVKTDSTHSGFYRVGTVCITKEPDYA